jgi:haloalkane dehalogenase
LDLAYREAGAGPAVLLLHGWPTSSFLWRDVMPAVATGHRVIAPDLPGFGASDKPIDAGYGFDLFSRVLDEFLQALDVGELAIAGHDIGGPIALKWALDNPGRVKRLALLNTFIYPDFHESVFEFVKACTTPELRDRLTSPDGLQAALRLGVAEPARVADEAWQAIHEPFARREDRLALAAAGVGLEPDVFAGFPTRLAELRIPVLLLYGERDAILPDVGQTMHRLAHDLPQAELAPLPDYGHFLQEEAGDEIGRRLATFFAGA